MRYDWDPIKYKENIQKHGVTFEEAQTIWDNPDAILTWEDKRHNEQRFVSIGWSRKNRQLFIVHCQRKGGVTWIISARKAERSERRRYLDHFSGKGKSQRKTHRRRR